MKVKCVTSSGLSRYLTEGKEYEVLLKTFDMSFDEVFLIKDDTGDTDWYYAIRFNMEVK